MSQNQNRIAEQLLPPKYVLSISPKDGTVIRNAGDTNDKFVKLKTHSGLPSTETSQLAQRVLTFLNHHQETAFPENPEGRYKMSEKGWAPAIVDTRTSQAPLILLGDTPRQVAANRELAQATINYLNSFQA